jgi:hypothetical protein
MCEEKEIITLKEWAKVNAEVIELSEHKRRLEWELQLIHSESLRLRNHMKGKSYARDVVIRIHSLACRGLSPSLNLRDIYTKILP